MSFTKVLGPGIHTLSNITSHNIHSSGIITAISFVGDGSGLTGVASTDNIITGTAATFTGGVDINSDIDVDGHTNLDNVSIAGVTTFSGGLTGTTANFSGNVTVGGVLTYEDVKNVDSIGVITARSGVDVDDFLDVGSNIKLGNAGVITATTFKGDGDFVELDVDGHTNLDNVNIAGVTTFTGAIDLNADLDVDGHTNLDNVSIAGVATATLFSGASEVGIQSGGVQIGAGITQLNFVGTGNTFAVNGTTVDISIAGGGGTGAGGTWSTYTAGIATSKSVGVNTSNLDDPDLTGAYTQTTGGSVTSISMVASAYGASPSSGPLQVTAPAGIQAGDLLIIMASAPNTYTAIDSNIPTGFTKIEDSENAVVDHRLSYKIAAGNESGTTYSGQTPGANQGNMNIFVFRGNASVTSVSVVATYAWNTTGSGPSSVSVAAGSGGSALSIITTSSRASNTNTITPTAPASGWTNYNNINGTGNNEVQALSWNFHTRNGNVTANTAFGDASRATAIGCVLTLGGGSSSTLPNRFQGLYISNGMIVHDNTLNGSHYIGTAFNGLMAGPVSIAGTLTIDGNYVVV